MSIVDFLDSVSLKNIRPVKLIANFERDNISPGAKEVKLNIQAVYGEDKSDANKYVLKFVACVEVKEEESNDEVLSVTFETDYLFDILNLEKISEITDEQKTAISSAIVYLDFRSRLVRVLADAGLNSVKIPLSATDHIMQE